MTAGEWIICGLTVNIFGTIVLYFVVYFKTKNRLNKKVKS